MSSHIITITSIQLDQLRLKDTYPDKKSWKDSQDRNRRDAERKLHDFSLLDKMKFSHSIQFNAVPDWSSHYISYSNLKKLYALILFKAPSPDKASNEAMESLG